MAGATWQGDLESGKGAVSAKSSNLFTDAPVTWAARTEEPEGMTSPEELIAAAHAACFCMALSDELTKRDHPPSRLQIEAVAAFEGGKVTRVDLDVTAEVPDLDEPGFREALHAAEGSCPVSNALRGNVEIGVKALLA
jgi:osmotically inducible protein OsmC